MATPIINIRLGDVPVDAAVIQAAKEPAMTARGWPQEMRDQANLRIMMDPQGEYAQSAMAALTAFEADLVETYRINSFNASLAEYRAAVARLARYPLATGQTEVTETRETEKFDEAGQPITETVVIAPAIDPLPAQIEQDVIDRETGEVTGTEMIDNPAIVQDQAERAAAQAVIDRTPQDVKDFAG